MEAAASDNLSDVDDAVAAAQELEALVAIYGGKSLLEDERADVGYWSTTAAIGAGACGDGTGIGGDGGVGGSACGADDYGSVCLEVVSPRNWRFRLGGGATLEVFIPRGYPSRESPTPLLHCDWLDSRGRAEMVGRLLAMYCGAEVVFEWVEMLRTELGEAVDAREAPLAPAEDGSRIGACGGAPSGCRMCLERGRESGGLPDDASSTVATAFGQASLLGGRDAHGGDGVGAGADAAGDGGSGFYFEPSTSGFGQRARRFGPEAMSQAHAVQIVHGEPFTPPGKSTFQGHCAAVTSKAQVDWALRTLLQEKKIARASHNMFAYRLVDADRRCMTRPRSDPLVQVADNDDDGESGAGAKLAALLELMGANNVMIVVSRWYGGVHLGPDRFKYIANVAREALVSAGHGGEHVRKTAQAASSDKAGKGAAATAGYGRRR